MSKNHQREWCCKNKMLPWKLERHMVLKSHKGSAEQAKGVWWLLENDYQKWLVLRAKMEKDNEVVNVVSRQRKVVKGWSCRCLTSRIRRPAFNRPSLATAPSSFIYRDKWHLNYKIFNVCIIQIGKLNIFLCGFTFMAIYSSLTLEAWYLNNDLARMAHIKFTQWKQNHHK